MSLIIAKQKACKSLGSNFYVTKSGIKRDFNLFGAKYEYKVYFKNGLYVEDSEGKKIESPKTGEKPKGRGRGSAKTTIPSELRNTTDEAASENAE